MESLLSETTSNPALTALSPLDGRYRADVAPLEPYFSEAALFRYRVRVEVEYLIYLTTRLRVVTFVPPFNEAQQGELRALYRKFDPQYAQEIAAWDRRVNHDVKAVEYWLRERLTAMGLEAWVEAVHFALTSEDVNNLAYSLLIQEARDQVLLPALKRILVDLREWAHVEADTPMLARTHGQPATPTTMGKELKVFVFRLSRTMLDLQAIEMTGKLNGASGSFAAHVAAYPNVAWDAFSEGFVRSLGMKPMLLTTQIEPHDTLAAVCDALKRVNTVMLDICQDFWRYISDEYFILYAEEGEVGSSTMPHKVNPIAFENGEGNLGLANALLEFMSRKLPVSRLQRDLSDSTVLRNLGVAWGYSFLAYRRIYKGIHKLAVNHPRLLSDLRQHPEVLAEAFQTILRRAGYPQPYEALKGLTRGRALTLDDLRAFLETLDIDAELRAELLALTPETYTGLAPRLARLL